MMMRGGGLNGAGIIGLVCSERGAEALEIAFVSLSHRLELTAEQQPLFDTLKANALTTQTSFADECQAAMPQQAAGTAPDMIEGIKARLAVEEARLEAINGILPDLEAFYGSLTDEQKAALAPRGQRFGGGDRMDRGYQSDRDASGRDAPGRNGQGRGDRAPAPGRN
jgi:hypothetical protein